MQRAALLLAAHCVVHCSALRLPSHRTPFFLSFPFVISPIAFSISPKSLSRRLIARQGVCPSRSRNRGPSLSPFPPKPEPAADCAAGRVSFPLSSSSPPPLHLPAALPRLSPPLIQRRECHVAAGWPSWRGVCSRKTLLCWEQICISGKVAVTLPHAYIYNKV